MPDDYGQETGTGHALAMVTVQGASPWAECNLRIRAHCEPHAQPTRMGFECPCASVPLITFLRIGESADILVCGTDVPAVCRGALVCRLAAGAALFGDGTALATAQGRSEGTDLDCGPGWCF